MDLKAVIFDLDGTLIDSMGVWADVDVEFLEKRNITPPKNIFADIDSGNSFEEVAKYFKNRFDLPQSIEEIMQEWVDMVTAHYEKHIPLKDGVRELLQYLHKQEVKLAVGTSNTKELTRRVLKSNDIYDFFDVIITGCQTERGKPYPDVFLKVSQKLGIPEKSCLVIEDVLVGVQAAKAANMRVFVIEDIHSREHKNVMQHEANFFASNFAKILEKIKTYLAQ